MQLCSMQGSMLAKQAPATQMASGLARPSQRCSRLVVTANQQRGSNSEASTSGRGQQPVSNFSHSIPHHSRRHALSYAGAVVSAVLLAVSPAQALGFTKELKKKKIPESDYTVSEDSGLRYYDLEDGRGDALKPGDRVKVHFDCIYRGIDVVSSRSSRLLGGNRTIAEAYEFVVGDQIYGVPVKKISDGANSLFSGAGGPKPPQALSVASIGMKRGGKRIVVVDQPELGYGVKGIGEMPANATFELKIEVLDVYPAKA